MTGAEYLTGVYLPTRIGMRSGSIQQYRIALSHFDAFTKNAKLSTWTPETLSRWLASLAGTCSGSTINSKRRAVLTIWRHAWETGEHPEAPRGVAKAREPKRVPRAWTLAEIDRLLEVVRSQPGTVDGIPASAWWESLVLAVFDTGERISAVRAVETVDVDLADGWLMIRAEAHKVAQDRLLGIAADTVAAIARIYDPTRELLWPWPMHRNTVWGQFRRMVKAAGIRYAGGHCNLFHRVRRTSGNLVEQAGGDGAKHLGHTRAVFEQSYRDPRFSRRSVDLLPRPERPTLRVVG